MSCNCIMVGGLSPLTGDTSAHRREWTERSIRWSVGETHIQKMASQAGNRAPEPLAALVGTRVAPSQTLAFQPQGHRPRAGAGDLLRVVDPRGPNPGVGHGSGSFAGQSPHGGGQHPGDEPGDLWAGVLRRLPT